MRFATLALSALSALPVCFSQGIFIITPKENEKIVAGKNLNLTIGHNSYSQNQEFVAASVVLIDPARPQTPAYVGSGLLNGDAIQVSLPGGGSGMGTSVNVPVPPTSPVGENMILNVTAWTLTGIQLETWFQYANTTVSVSSDSGSAPGASGSGTTNGPSSSSAPDTSDSDSAAPSVKKVTPLILSIGLIPALVGFTLA